MQYLWYLPPIKVAAILTTLAVSTVAHSGTRLLPTEHTAVYIHVH